MLNYIDHEEEIRKRLREEWPEFPEEVVVKPEAIRSIRTDKKFTQKRVEDLTGISQSMLSRYESEDPTYRSIVAVYALSMCLGVGIGDIAEVPLSVSGRLTNNELDLCIAQLEKVAYVKTLAKPGEDDVDLRSFYYRTHITHKIKDDVISQEATSLAVFEGKPSIVQGTAGQGKSILLRYLTLQTLAEHKTIPIFLELRQLRGRTIREEILERLHLLKLDVDDKRLDHLLEIGSIALLLDAFDELQVNARANVLRELEKMHERYDAVQIVISSRPQAGLTMQHWLKVFDVATLTPCDVDQVVRLYAGKKEAVNILRHLGSSSVSIVGLLLSPLMVLLLVLHFRYTEYVPHSTVAFYKDLLHVLLRRHNISEEGPKRTITSGIEEQQLRKFFQAFCFVCERDFSDADIHRADMEDAAAKALDLAHVDASATRVLDDIVSITNLVIEEGGFCRFIHKSVKEYYGAAFIAAASLENAGRFYLSMRTKWYRWQGELQFLKFIDRNRCAKLFLIPDLESARPFTEAKLLSEFSVVSVSGILKSSKPLTLAIGESPLYCMKEREFTVKIKSLRQLESFMSPKLVEYIRNELEQSIVGNERKSASGQVVLDRGKAIGQLGNPHWNVLELAQSLNGKLIERTSQKTLRVMANELNQNLSQLVAEITDDLDRGSEFEV